MRDGRCGPFELPSVLAVGKYADEEHADTRGKAVLKTSCHEGRCPCCCVCVLGVQLSSGGHSSGAAARRPKAGQGHTLGQAETSHAPGRRLPPVDGPSGAEVFQAHHRGCPSADHKAAASAVVAACSAGGCQAGDATTAPLLEAPCCANRAAALIPCPAAVAERCFLAAVAAGAAGCGVGAVRACSSGGFALWLQSRRCGGGRSRATLPENGASLPGNTAAANWP